MLLYVRLDSEIDCAKGLPTKNLSCKKKSIRVVSGALLICCNYLVDISDPEAHNLLHRNTRRQGTSSHFWCPCTVCRLYMFGPEINLLVKLMIYLYFEILPFTNMCFKWYLNWVQTTKKGEQLLKNESVKLLYTCTFKTFSLNSHKSLITFAYLCFATNTGI